MPLGNSFINVLETVPTPPSDDSAIEQALAAAGDGPCTFWISRPIALREIHELPSTVTLSFAPGAYVNLYNSLTVRGPLDAGLERRFVMNDGATLALLGSLDEIVADWWSALKGISPVERALTALWTRYQNACLPVPIRLDGPYPLSTPLRIRPPADLRGRREVKLRGQWARSIDPATFVAAGGDPGAPMSTLLSVEDGVVLLVDRVGFDAGSGSADPQALACLSLEGTFHGSRVEACGFRYDWAGVRVSPNVQRWTELTGDSPPGERAHQGMLDDAIAQSTGHANGLTVGWCVFTGASDDACGIDVNFGAPSSLELRDSQFVGRFANAVAMHGGDATINACQFASESRRVNFYDSPRATADVLVRRWGDDTEFYDWRFKWKSWPIPQVKLRGSINVYRGQALANTHLTVVHCTSTSPIFLVMHPTFDYSDTASGGAVLINVRHRTGSALPTSIHLGSGMSSRSLMLQGCHFEGSVLVGPTTRSDVVVELGLTYAEAVDGAVGFFTFPGRERVEVITLSTTP